TTRRSRSSKTCPATSAARSSRSASTKPQLRERRRRGTRRAVMLSIVIPVLDEEARIGRCLEAARALEGVSEVIVVDGGSRDRTLEVVGEAAERTAGARLVVATAPRGRGLQMNAGARAASGDVL